MHFFLYLCAQICHVRMYRRIYVREKEKYYEKIMVQKKIKGKNYLMKNLFSKFILLLLLCVAGVGQAWAYEATIFFAPGEVNADWDNWTECWVNVNHGGWVNYQMENTGLTYNGHTLYYKHYTDASQDKAWTIEFHKAVDDWTGTKVMDNVETYSSVFNNKLWNGSSWVDDVKYIYGDGDGNWLNGQLWVSDAVSNLIVKGTTRTYTSCAPGLKSFRLTGSSTLGYSNINLAGSNVTCYTNEHNNICFSTVATADITIGYNDSGISINVTYSDLGSALNEILNNQKIMFYYGDGWTTDCAKYLHTTDSPRDNHYSSVSIHINDRRLATAIVEPGVQYWVANDGNWAGLRMTQNAKRGGRYTLYSDNGDQLDESNGVLPSWTTSSATIAKETSSSGLAATCNNSVIGRSQTISYYYTLGADNGSASWTEFNPASVGSLAVGNYTVRALAFDDNIYVRTESAATLTVYAAITLNNHGATSAGTTSVNAELGSEAANIDVPTKTGYTFQGYYTEEDGSGTKVINANGTWNSSISNYTDGSGNFIAEANSTLHAHWTENMTTVTLAASPASKGSFSIGGEAATEFTAGVSTTHEVTAVPVTGYYVNTSATVWSSNNGNISLSDASTNPTTVSGGGTAGTSSTLTATFTPNPYSVHFNGNGNTGGSMSDQAFTYDEAQNLSENTYTRTGYTFDGWATAADGAKVYNDEQSVSNLTATKDGTFQLYAHWVANEYLVTLSCSSEAGYGSSPSGVKASVTATYDAAMPAMGTAPTPLPGYKFEGYWTAAGGTGTKYYNADGSSAKAWDIASATTLYAYFKKTEIIRLEHDGSVPSGSEITLDVNPVFNQTGAEGYTAVCWSLLYDNGNPVESGWAVASNPVGDKTNQVRFTLTGFSSGYYKVKAVLKANATSAFDPCNAGTELMYIESDLRIAGNSKVTIQYQDTLGNTIAASGSVEVARGDAVGIKAPNIVGYTFYKWILGDVLDSVCESEAVCGTRHDSIRITASYDGILTATYVKKQMIYFNNALGWDDVYVYFYNDGSGNEYWAEGYGTGANQVQYFNGNQPYFEGEHGHMTQIEGTNIWYFDFKAAGYNTTRTKVAFATKDQSINESTDDNAKIYFHNASVVYRNDFDAAHLPMFVPIDSVKYNYTGNTGSKYYHGYWMNYPDSTGYKLEIYNQVNQAGAELLKEKVFTFNADKRMPMSVTVDLEAGRTYGFKIYRTDNTYYSNGNTMTNGHSGDGTQAVWQFTTDVTNNAGLTTTSAGDYIFTLKYGKDYGDNNYNYLVGVHYPEATGDFRVQYKDAVHTNWRTSSVIPEGSERDTVSYFVRTGEGKNPYIRVQKCTATWDGSSTTVNWNNENDGADILPDTISADGVYNFIFTKSNGALVLEKVEPYTGNFYIRVDGAGSTNWDNFRAADHMMPYSDYSIKQTAYPYSHYFCKWYDVGGSTKNIKFVVANDYSVNISDTVTQDGIANTYVDVNGFLNRNANVRFMYNYKTNEATRRYVDGARGAGSDEFLKILLPNATDVSIRNHNNTADSLVSEVKFKDNGDWIYEADIKAKPGTTYKLRSHFGEGVGEVIQWFKGSAESYETLIGGTGSDFMSIRLIYDFKTNRVVSAYLPSGTINDSLKIHADVMFMRDHQGDVEQITFATGKAITDIQNIYCGLRFNKWTLNNKSTEEGHATLSPLLSRYERDIYYVSLPYDVRVSDIIGFGTYGKHWIVEYYDGAARAENGFWADSETYWRYVTPAMKDNFIMKAGTGYIVALDLDELYYIDATHHSSIWDNTDEVELLFPGDVSSISDRSVTYNMPTHYCTINRETPLGDRRIKDSHWNVLGVPTFKNITGAAAEPEDGGGSGAIRFANTAWIKDTLDNDLKFIYDGNLADNSLTPKAVKGFAFKAMHAYVVQYSGDVTFSTSATSVSPIVARRTYAEQPRDVDFRLELNKNGVMEDQTFISLSNDENASAEFVFGEDMSKEFNKNKANIYTFIGTEQAAGNTLPMREQKTEVPVGVKIAADGDYTFAIPEGTAGVGVTLLDNETGVRTSLSALDYTINLTAGTYNKRFVLEISPIVQSPTGIENTEHRTQNTDVRKVLIDNILYIVKDGVMYDARGARVQ